MRQFARVGFWSCNVRTGKVEWSAEVESLLGWDRTMQEQPLQNLFEHRVDPRDYPALYMALENALVGGQSFTCDFRARYPSETLTWLSIAAVPVKDDGGKVLYLRGILQYIGERKATESRSQQFISLFETVFATTATLMSLSDPETDLILDINPSFEDITGYAREEAIGRTWTELGLGAADDRDAILAALHERGSVRNRRVSGRTRAGESLELQSSITLIEIDGRVRMLSIAENITGLVRSEQALRRSEERFDLAMRGSNDGLWDLDMRTKTVYYSPRWKEMLGYQDDELANEIETWQRVIDLDSDARSKELVSELIAGDSNEYACELRLRHKNGHWLEVLARAYLVRDDQGEPARLVGTHTDITPLKQAVAAAERERQRAEDYLRIAAVIMVALDDQGRVTLINPKGSELLGRDQAEILGRDWFVNFLPASARDNARAIFARLLSGQLEGTETADAPILTADGRERVISWRTSVLTDADGRVLGTLSSGLDVTARRAAEAALALERGFLQHVIDGIDAPIMVIAKDYRLIRMNRAASNLAEERGLDEERLSCYRLLYDSDRPCREPTRPCPLAKVLAEGNPVKVMHSCKIDGEHGSAAQPTLELSASPLRDDQDEVLGVIEVVRDISEELAMAAELKRSELSVARLSQYDLLTSLPNRLLFSDRLSAGIAAAHLSETCLAAVIVDLDRFQQINDSFDHQAGDTVLKAVAGRLQKLVGEQETLARLGGDEFGIIPAPFQKLREPADFAERIHDALLHPFELHDQRVAVGASIGIALYPAQGNTADDLLRKADAALYSAKAEGGRVTRFFTEELTADGRDRLELEVSLQDALERDEFELYYQPQVNLRDGRLDGAEALIRWRHPSRGIVSPGRFIPLAEESGLINPLGDWVLRTACAQMHAWREAGVMPLGATMAVNLSARQFEQKDLAKKVLQIIEQSGLAPSALEIEITESTVMQSPRRSINCLQQLRQAGVKAAVDDFGTGYSSMSYLKRLPLTKLKIDQSFVSDLPEDGNDAAIARAIIALGTSLSLELLAEGIEDPAQRDFLLDAGCELGQGYLFAKPLPVEDFACFARHLLSGEAPRR